MSSRAVSVAAAATAALIRLSAPFALPERPVSPPDARPGLSAAPARPDIADDHFVQRPDLLLPVRADERNRAPSSSSSLTGFTCCGVPFVSPAIIVQYLSTVNYFHHLFSISGKMVIRILVLIIGIYL